MFTECLVNQCMFHFTAPVAFLTVAPTVMAVSGTRAVTFLKTYTSVVTDHWGTSLKDMPTNRVTTVNGMLPMGTDSTPRTSTKKAKAKKSKCLDETKCRKRCKKKIKQDEMVGLVAGILGICALGVSITLIAGAQYYHWLMRRPREQKWSKSEHAVLIDSDEDEESSNSDTTADTGITDSTSTSRARSPRDSRFASVSSSAITDKLGEDIMQAPDVQGPSDLPPSEPERVYMPPASLIHASESPPNPDEVAEASDMFDPAVNMDFQARAHPGKMIERTPTTKSRVTFTASTKSGNSSLDNDSNSSVLTIGKKQPRGLRRFSSRVHDR
ncbi:hypothetical protein K461DRAFT_102175 [Myriangium duriaei CBS 260.36]|uniref:Uncharacterized protein n=1 Tax=Myriangium duriaei CBS 260.36 TaxID=1168546 RepID=A0A9P4MIY6_9PEZI|nr:hypothetical protein K461DRAFT_102175 [Myriangium duriaei CBS 260.36]